MRTRHRQGYHLERTPLMLAASNMNLDFVSILLQYGADKTINFKDEKGNTALHLFIHNYVMCSIGNRLASYETTVETADVFGTAELLISAGASTKTLNHVGICVYV